MKIPIANIYYLLCYAWDRLEEREVVDVHPEDETELIDLFARVLISGTNHLLRRGIDRGYVLHEESIPGIRGKFIAAETIKRNLLITAHAHCGFDEISVDVIHNQILKATFAAILRSRDLDSKLLEEARDLHRRLGLISDIDLTPSHFRRVQLHRNNYAYDLLLKVCRFLFDNLMIEERTGRARFRDFDRDERQMRLLFQEFAYNFFRRHLPMANVTAPQIEWYGVDRNQDDVSTLPVMKTDIVISTPKHAVVIDTKFTPNAFQSYYDVERARSGHLYQIFTYVKNYALAHPEQGVSGMLLYPVIEAPFACSYPLSEHTIEIRSIDLRQPWRRIEVDMKNLVDIGSEAQPVIRGAAAEAITST